MSSVSVMRVKRLIVILALLVVAAALFLPNVVITGQEKFFRGVDLIRSSTAEFEVVILGAEQSAGMNVNIIPLIFSVLAIVAAFAFVIFPVKNEKKMRATNGILGLIMMAGVLISYASLHISLDSIEVSMGIGIYLNIIGAVIFLMYACTPYKLPITEVNIYILLMIAGALFIYPYLNTLALSFDQSGERIGILPRQWTLNNFKFVLFNPKFYNGVFITVSRTVIGTISALLCTAIFSYGLSKPQLIGRKVYLKICVFTMYFGGGLIPTFLLFTKLGLTNNYMVYIIPNLISVFNMILMVNYFMGLPVAFEESARIDGAKEFTILFRIILPVSMPIIAIIALYNAVFQWNSWYDAYLYMMGKPNLKPLQNVLIDIINESQISNFLADLPIPIKELMAAPVGRSIVSASIILTIGPIILFYPYLQRYFVKGMLLGSIKG